MPERTAAFVTRLVGAHGEDISTVVQFGSSEGARDLTLSDLDFFILVRDRRKAGVIFSSAQKIQKEVFGIKTSWLGQLVQRSLLGSCSYGGIHLLIAGRDELDSLYRPRSVRLRLMTALIGRNIFLQHVREHHRVLFGEDIAVAIVPAPPGKGELISCFLFPALVLALALPSLLYSRNAAMIWSCKAIKYHHDNLMTYFRLKQMTPPSPPAAYAFAKAYRYRPTACPWSPFRVYGLAWATLFHSVGMLFLRTRGRPSPAGSDVQATE